MIKNKTWSATMRKTTVFFALLFATCAAFGQVQQTVTINSYDRTAPTLQYYQANEITIPVTLKNGTNAANITGLVPFFSWATSTNAGGIVTASCAIVNSTGGTFNATFSRSNLNANGYFIYEAGAATSAGVPVVYRQGTFQLIRSPYAAGVGPAQVSSNLDFSIVTAINAPWVETNDMDGVTLVKTNGKWTAIAAAAPDLVARAAIVEETNRAQLAEIALSNQTVAATQNIVVVESDPIWGLVSNTVTEGAALGSTALQSFTESDPVSATSKVSIVTFTGHTNNASNPHQVTAAQLGALTNAAFAAQDGVTVSGQTLSIGTNLFGVGATSLWQDEGGLGENKSIYPANTARIVNATAGLKVLEGDTSTKLLVTPDYVRIEGNDVLTNGAPLNGSNITAGTISTDKMNFNVATNAGSAGAGYYVMTNGVWTNVVIGAGGASQSPWTGPINGAGYSLTNAGNVTATGAVTATRYWYGTNAYRYWNGTGVVQVIP